VFVGCFGGGLLCVLCVFGVFWWLVVWVCSL
jgi:hypothetical protein